MVPFNSRENCYDYNQKVKFVVTCTYELRVLLFFILSPATAVFGRAVSFYTVEGIAGRDRNDKSYRVQNFYE